MTVQELDDWFAAHPQVVTDSQLADHSLRRSATVLSLARAVVGHGGPDYTDPVTLKAASAEFAAKGKHVLEEYDALVANLEVATQVTAYGGAPPDYPGLTFLAATRDLSGHMTDHELHAAETFLRSCLTE